MTRQFQAQWRSRRAAIHSPCAARTRGGKAVQVGVHVERQRVQRRLLRRPIHKGVPGQAKLAQEIRVPAFRHCARLVLDWGRVITQHIRGPGSLRDHSIAINGMARQGRKTPMGLLQMPALPDGCCVPASRMPSYPIRGKRENAHIFGSSPLSRAQRLDPWPASG